MPRTITIDPVTRIEGHAHISIYLNDDDQVEDAQLHVTQLRGFEKLAEGRPFREMPALTARICGICPVSHLLASAKACDQLLGVQIPPTAVKLRRLLNYAQLVQSHALNFFYLSAPDLLLGMDADPQRRNIFGLIDVDPELARQGIRLRQFGQNLIEQLGGKRIHTAWVAPGGVTDPLRSETRDSALKAIPEVTAIALRALDLFKSIIPNFQEEIRSFANLPTLHMGLVSEENVLEHYDGRLRIVDESGQVIESSIEPSHYQDSIGEAVEPHSYLKSPYYKPMGYPEGVYRVGPLSRLYVAERCGTPIADGELKQFRKIAPLERRSSFYYHYARLIEILHGIERIEQLLNEPDILDRHVLANAMVNTLEGVGISEAPRGTLIHHYRIDKHGVIAFVNLIVATGHNNLAMNRGVKQVAQHFIHGETITEGMLNRVEAVIRAFDPCLSCASHAIGQMPLRIELRNAQNEVVDEVCRG
jgi:NAD-reducing hydrogenase large subunit